MKLTSLRRLLFFFFFFRDDLCRKRVTLQLSTFFLIHFKQHITSIMKLHLQNLAIPTRFKAQLKLIIDLKIGSVQFSSHDIERLKKTIPVK